MGFYSAEYGKHCDGRSGIMGEVDATAIMQMIQKNLVNTRVVERKMKIFKTGIILNFKVLSCDMANVIKW